MKRCSRCKLTKPVVEFSRDCKRGDGFSYVCKSCKAIEKKEFAKTDRGRISLKNQTLKYTYGISLSDWNKMYDSQNGLCKICKKRQATETDHDHNTGKVRGILCKTCNVGIGFFQDDAAMLRAALDYLMEV